MSADLYIDASVSDKRKNGKCSVVILVGDDEEYLWTQSITFEKFLEMYPSQTGATNHGLGSSAYETYSLLGLTQILIDKQLSNMDIVCYTDNLGLFNMCNNIWKPRIRKITGRICKSLFVNIEILKQRNISIDVRWIRSHVNVYGNEKADFYTRNSDKLMKPIESFV